MPKKELTTLIELLRRQLEGRVQTAEQDANFWRGVVITIIVELILYIFGKLR